MAGLVLMGQKIGSSADLLNYIDTTYGFGNASGRAINPETALRLSAVHACVSIISRTIAALPLHVYRRTSKNGQPAKELASDHELEPILSRKPNAIMTRYQWVNLKLVHLLTRGNAYDIVMRVNGRVDELAPVHPDLVQVFQPTPMDKGYRIRRNGGETKDWVGREAERIVHLMGLTSNGLEGRHPIQDAREALGLAAEAESYGAKTLANGGTSRVALKHPFEVDENVRRRMRDSWVETYGKSGGAGLPLILEEGTDLTTVSLPAKDLQFIEARKFQIAELARFYNVPLHKINELDRSTNNNIEQQALEFAMDTILPWLVNIEQSLNAALFAEDPEHFCEFNMAGLLRADVAAQAEAFSKGRQWGWLSVNDVRRLLNMNPIEGGDSYLIPGNMAVMDADGNLEPALASPAPAPGAEADPRKRLAAIAAAGKNGGDHA